MVSKMGITSKNVSKKFKKCQGIKWHLNESKIKSILVVGHKIDNHLIPISN